MVKGGKDMPDYFLKALFAVVGLMLIERVYALAPHAKGWASRAALHAVTGLAALFTANTTGSLLGLGVGLNTLTLTVSAALGAPGVGLLWAVKYLL